MNKEAKPDKVRGYEMPPTHKCIFFHSWHNMSPGILRLTFGVCFKISPHSSCLQEWRSYVKRVPDTPHLFLISFDLAQALQILISWQEKSAAAGHSLPAETSFCLRPIRQLNQGFLASWWARCQAVGSLGNAAVPGNCMCPSGDPRAAHTAVHTSRAARQKPGPAGPREKGPRPTPRMWARPSLQLSASGGRSACCERWAASLSILIGHGLVCFPWF